MKTVSFSLPRPSPLQISSSSSLISLVKFKALLQTLILSLARAKTTALHFLREANRQSSMALKKNKNKLLFGSFRLHYNWCSSSHVTPAPVTWDYSGSDGGDPHGLQLSGYLQWLEDRDGNRAEADVNEIDKLAEIFIARSHEKFRLEKQESYRRFQEMITTTL